VRARLWTLGSLILTTACGPAADTKPVVAPLAPPVAHREAPPVTPDAPFRAIAPVADGKLTFKPPTFRKTALRNGIPVYYAPKPDVPLVTIHLVARGGADELGTTSGLGSMLGAMLEQGTKKLSAIAISDKLEELGAQHSSYVGWSSSGLAITVPKEKVPAALELLADLALQSTFPDAELERLRSRRLAALAAEQSNPAAAFGNVSNASVFGRAHPYGAPLGGLEKDVKAIKRTDLVRAYKQLFAKGRLAIAVAGDVEDGSMQPLLEQAFGKLTGGKTAPKPPADPALPKHAIALVDKAGPQAQIGVVGIGVPATSKDRIALSIMNTILGGPFSSRVNMNLREKHAYTYGARSDYAQRAGSGPFTVRAAVVADKTVPALKELLSEVARMRSTDVTPAELSAAKDYSILTLPARFETTDDLARAATELHVYDWPLDEYATRAARYEAVTVADVRRVAETFLDPKRWRVVIVGDGKLSPELGALEQGPIEGFDAFGAVLAPGAAKPN
jgi:zinc protease